jgi:hypothetical protein
MDKTGVVVADLFTYAGRSTKTDEDDRRRTTTRTSQMIHPAAVCGPQKGTRTTAIIVCIYDAVQSCSFTYSCIGWHTRGSVSLLIVAQLIGVRTGRVFADEPSS